MVLTGAVNAGTIAAHIRLDSTLDKDASKAQKSLRTLTGALAGVTVAAGAAALALSATIGKQVILVGSEVEDMQGKFDAVFKETANDVEEWADTFGDAVGRSRFELMGLASSLQDTFVPMKFTREEGAELSKQLVELAVDLNSFNVDVVSDKAAMEDLQSAIVGNHETMRKYGVIITQATLDQELLTMGINGGTRAATEQQKATARLNLILEGTTDAQGVAIRTAGSFANQLRGLKGNMSEMMGEAGRDELPEMTKVLTDFDDWGKAGGYEDVQGFFSDVAAGTTAAAKGISSLTKAMTTIWSEFTGSIEEDIASTKESMNDYNQFMLDFNPFITEENRKILEANVAAYESSLVDLKVETAALGIESSKTADTIVEDAKAVQEAYDTEIPGFAGQSEYIKSLIQEKGIKLTKEDKKAGVTELDKLLGTAPTVSAVTPSTITAGTPQATAVGGSVSMLRTINTSIKDGNTAIVTAINSISLGAGRTGGGFGAGDSTQASPETIYARMKQNFERASTSSMRL